MYDVKSAITAVLVEYRTSVIDLEQAIKEIIKIMEIQKEDESDYV